MGSEAAAWPIPQDLRREWPSLRLDRRLTTGARLFGAALPTELGDMPPLPRRAREEAGLTQVQVAKRLGRPQTWVSKCEDRRAAGRLRRVETLLRPTPNR